MPNGPDFGDDYFSSYRNLDKQIPSNVTEQALRRGRYRTFEHAIRALIVSIPLSHIKEFLDTLPYLQKKVEIDNLIGLLAEEPNEDEDQFTTEEYDDLINVDEYLEKESLKGSPFDDTGLSYQKSHLFDLAIEMVSEKEFVCYTPGDSFISSYGLHPAYSKIPKAIWLTPIVLKALDERQKHLRKMGALLCKKMTEVPGFFSAPDLEEAFSQINNFTVEDVTKYLKVVKQTVGRLRKGTKVVLPKWGVVELDRVFDMTKGSQRLWLDILKILRTEDPQKPFKLKEIASRVGEDITRERIGQLFREHGIPSRASDRKRLHAENRTTWIKD